MHWNLNDRLFHPPLEHQKPYKYSSPSNSGSKLKNEERINNKTSYSDFRNYWFHHPSCIGRLLYALAGLPIIIFSCFYVHFCDYFLKNKFLRPLYLPSASTRIECSIFLWFGKKERKIEILKENFKNINLSAVWHRSSCSAYFFWYFHLYFIILNNKCFSWFFFNIFFQIILNKININ